jgi:hypothetical protein
MTKALKRTYHPQKTFDDDFDAFARTCQANGWEVLGINGDELLVDVEAQRAERAELEAVRAQYVTKREQFAAAQEARYLKFLAVLNALRGRFRDDKVVRAGLERFKRANGRSQRSVEENV